MQVHSATSLKLHSYAINRLHDPNWTGMELYDELKQWWRGRREPTNLFHKIQKHGVLFQLGRIFFDEYHNYEIHIETLKEEYKLWFMEDHISFCRFHEAKRRKDILDTIQKEIERIDSLYVLNEEEYWETLESEQFDDWFFENYHAIDTMESQAIEKIREGYCFDFANRVFSDLVLCTHISFLIRTIGISSQLDDEPYVAWVKRTKIPSWAERAVVRRDNGLCVSCKKDLNREFTAPRQIDHIVPLALSGINDLVNLQLMCDKCNRKKHAVEMDSFNSIPDYMQVGLTRQSKQRRERRASL